MKIYLSSSKHLYEKIPAIQRYLELQGHSIILPNSMDNPLREEELKQQSPEAHAIWKSANMQDQVTKINASDAILVLNYEKNGMPNYIGGATFMEIHTAYTTKKKIFLLNPIPYTNFKDELSAMQPIVLHGDLTQIDLRHEAPQAQETQEVPRGEETPAVVPHEEQPSLLVQEEIAEELMEEDVPEEEGVKVGIIGGSGMDDPELLENYEKVDMVTPYGQPSSSITQGTVNGVEVAILARHGKSHEIMPTNVNNRANIWALAELGCTHILATTAVGSLKEEIAPGHLVFIDQFIDRTTKRQQTFHDTNEVLHTPMAEPFNEDLRKVLIATANELGLEHHTTGTVVTIEGPRFSTKAESNLFRSWDCDIINMSTVPEVVLANELEMPYAAIAMSTDYDCWRESTEPVTFEEVMRVMKANADKVKHLIHATLKKIH